MSRRAASPEPDRTLPHASIAVPGLLALLAASAPADLCGSLTRAYLAAEADPAATVGHGIAGSRRCSTSDGDLRCTCTFDDAAEARRAFADMGATATACLAAQGLSPRRKLLGGVETLSLETATAAPNGAIFYSGGSTVTIAIVTTR